MTDLDTTLRQQIGAYLADEDADASDLASCLEIEMYSADDEPEAVRRLANDALRLLAEHENGDWTDEELGARLGALSRTYWIQQAPKIAWSDWSGVTSHWGQSASLGRRPSVELAS